MTIDAPNYQYQIGTSRAAGDLGTVTLAVRSDLPGPLMGAGQYGPLLSDSSGSLRTSIGALTYAYRHGAGTFLLKSGSGRLARMIVNAVQAGSVTVWDSLTATGSKLLVVNLQANSVQAFEVGAAFTAGLTVVTTAANFDLTVVYD